ncbi:MAG TPA: hypothetical protein VGE09_06295 [Pseudoxanthomonas sp.]
MLPQDLRWQYSERFAQHWLLLGGEHVAMVDAGGPGRWRVMVNRHRPMGKLTSGEALTLEHGKKMAERWATANIDRLRIEVAARAASRPRHRV